MPPTPIQFGIINRADTAALSGGQWFPTLPITNLQRYGLVYPARSADVGLSDTTFSIDFGNTTTLVRMFCIMQHNFSVGALYRLTGGSTAGASDLYDSGWLPIWPRIYMPEDLDFEEPNWWTGQISAEDALLYPIKLRHDLGANYLVRYWKVEFDDQVNDVGYVEIRRLFFGPIWQPKFNYAPGAALQWTPRDRGIESRAGVRYFERLPSRRVQSINLQSLLDAEAFGRALDMQRRLGSEGEVLVIPEPDNVAQAHRRDLWARVLRAGPVAQSERVVVQQMAIDLEELL